MPLQNGEMHADFFGATPQAQLADKIVQMRRDLMHIQRALSAIEGRVKTNAPSKTMKAEFSILHDWFLSAMESFLAMVWAGFEREKAKEVIRDFENKFRNFATARTLHLAGRPKH